ncbi:MULTISPECIES: hypothetical protein [unclassified Desulfovibrio]|uniref:hypothetical protein n=1 Tax=unclassified Desulfovibrio TaxID=2593640 RepID=UPI0013ECB8C4|nr:MULTISPECIES: hypothetical protein [unclassified Desulfovibrio]
MFRKTTAEGPWACSKCGSRHVELRDMRPGIPLLDKLSDLLGAPGDPRRQWGAKRVICKDCGHVSVIHVM